MIRRTPHPSWTAGISPRIRPARHRILCGVVAACLLVSGSVFAGPNDPVKQIDLLPSLSARIMPDGHLVFGSESLSYLQVDVAPPGDARRVRRHGDSVFVGEAREGVDGGFRGYSSRADDDGDGRTDEEILDGRDNDGDGRIDEDYAAVGDVMVAFHLADGPAGRPLHLEYYHWAHAHLRSAVFLGATGRPDLVDAGALRVKVEGEDWREVAIIEQPAGGSGHPARAGGSAFVSRVVPPNPVSTDVGCDPRFNVWIGVRALETGAEDGVRISGSRLDIELDNGMQPLVFAAAESRQQLLGLLDLAVLTYRGVHDPVSGRRTPWVAPPLCTGCRQAEAPAVTWRAGESGGTVLLVSRTHDHGSLLDPDLFVVGDRPLGAPDMIRWVADDGSTHVTDWGCESSGPGSWARFETPSGRGHVEYEFPRVDPSELDPADIDGTIIGRYLDGRPLQAPLTTVVELPAIGIGLSGTGGSGEETAGDPMPVSTEENARVLRDASRQPTLSPALLEGWPNPFRDQIQLKFTVPRTMEEAFVWDDPEDRPADLDLQAAVPWTGGNPRVSVRIYSINGQELVTLEAADLGVGEYTVQWNGTDAYGRQVASGTYFCKLQLDEWNVTRRLVFLR